MNIAAYGRACDAASVAIAEQYLECTGAPLPADFAQGLSLAAVRAFLNEAKGSPAQPHEVQFVEIHRAVEGSTNE